MSRLSETMKTPLLTLNTGTWSDKVNRFTLRQLNPTTNRTWDASSPATLLSCERCPRVRAKRALDQALGKTFYKGRLFTAVSLAKWECRVFAEKKKIQIREIKKYTIQSRFLDLFGSLTLTEGSQ